jgi:hypothetical protein
MKKQDEKNELRAQVIQELRESIKKYGLEAGPKLVRERYPDVPRANWYRWLNAVAASPMEVAVDAAVKAVAKHLPAAPPPSYINERPVEARQGINFMERLEHLYDDAEMLRAWSTSKVTDAAGRESERIKVPQYFSQSIKLRSDLLETAVRTVQQFYDLRRMQQFYDSVLEEIAAESPEVAQRIAERLSKLDSELGMTVNCRV